MSRDTARAMSEENVEVVRRFNEGYDGEDVIPALRAAVERFVPEPDRATVLAAWADDPSWRHVHPEIDWDVSGAGAFGTAVKGPVEVAAWWVDWLETWESYVYRVVEYRALGDWVLVPSDVSARGRTGIPVEMRIFQIFSVRDGKVDACRVFLTEPEALEAAALRE
jgi:ketosteroid isomerase-like protein